MRRSVVLLVVAALWLGMLPSGGAGDADDPEVSDPSGDVVKSCSGDLCPVAEQGDAPAFDDVDLTAAWVTENDATFAFVITSVGDVQSGTATNLSFTLERDPGGTPDPTAYAVNLTGANVDAGPNGTTAALAGATLTVTLTKATVDAGPGDLVRDIVVARSRSETQGLPLNQVDPVWTGTDRAPDDGTGRDYVLASSTATPGVQVTLDNGRIPNGTVQGCTSTASACVATDDPDAVVRFDLTVENTGSDLDVFSLAASVAGGPAASLDPADLTLAAGAAGSAVLTIDLAGAAAGTYTTAVSVTSGHGASATAEAIVEVTGETGDPYGVGSLGGFQILMVEAPDDGTAGTGLTFSFQVDGEGGTVRFTDLLWDTMSHPDSAILSDYPFTETDIPNAETPYLATFTVPFDAGTYYVRGHAEVDGVGHLLTEEVTLTVAAAGEAGPREPILAGLDWLQPTAEAVGFDALFGRFAELALLALMLILIIILVFLVLMLAQTAWVEVQVRPKRRSVKPGQAAEFKVRVKNLKKAPRKAEASFRSDHPWKTGLQLKKEEGGALDTLTQQGAKRQFELTPRKEDGDEYEGVLRVMVPADAAGERAELDLNVVPFDEFGEERPRRGHRAHFAVVAKGRKPKPPKAPAQAATGKAAGQAPGKAAPQAAKRTADGRPGDARTGPAPGTRAPGAARAAPRPAAKAPPLASRDTGRPHVRLAGVRHDPRAPMPGDTVQTHATLQNDDATPVRLRVVLMVGEDAAAEQPLQIDAHSSAGVTFTWTAQAGDNRVRVRVFKA